MVGDSNKQELEEWRRATEELKAAHRELQVTTLCRPSLFLLIILLIYFEFLVIQISCLVIIHP